MREGVGPDDGLVGLHRNAGDLREEPGRLVNLLGFDSGVKAVQILARGERHDDFLHGRVARPLADAVDRAFDLARARADGGQRVGHRQPQIVVAVDGENRPVDVFDVGEKIGDEVAEFLGDGIADRVRNIDGDRARIDDGRDHLHEIVAVRSRGVHRRELYVVGVGFCQPDGRDRFVEHLRPALLELVFQVDVRRRNKGMDARMRRGLDGLPGPVDVHFVGAGQTRHLGFPDDAGNLPDCVEVSFRGDGKPGLDDIHAEIFELPGQKQFFLRVHAVAGRLLSVAQRRVENVNAVFIFFHKGLLCLYFTKCFPKRKRPWDLLPTAFFSGDSLCLTFSDDLKTTGRRPLRPGATRRGPEAGSEERMPKS